MVSVTGDVCFVRSYPLASFGHVQNFKLTPPDKDVRWMNVSNVVCPVLMRQASCTYPVCICRCLFYLSCGTVNFRPCNG